MQLDVSKYFYAALVAVSLLATGLEAAPPDSTIESSHAVEARGRARLLHETIHATLHIVHLEYYREDESLKIPAATLQRVFDELAARQNVEVRWLAVNAQAMNPNHKARDEFEQAAVAALTAGKDEYEQLDDQHLRWAGAITLSSSCLRCHAPNRTSTKDRVAALAIKLPLDKP